MVKWDDQPLNSIYVVRKMRVTNPVRANMKEEIEKIFGKLYDYSEYKSIIRFWVYRFNAEKLFALSDLTGVNEIQCEGHHEDGGCDTCGYGEEDGVEISFKI